MNQEVKLLCQIATKTALPITENLLVSPTSIMATNLEISAITKINTGFKESFMVEASMFLKAINSIPNPSFKLEDTTITIKNNTSKIKLPILRDVENFPDMAINNSELFAIDKKTFDYIAKGISQFTSTDELRPTLTAVYFSDDIVATDAHALGKMKAPVNIGDVLVPPKVLRVAASFSGNIQMNKNTIVIGNTTITYRPIDGKYVSYEAVIPKESAFTINIEKADLINALKVISISANNNSFSCVFEFDSGRLNLSTSDIDYSREASMYIPYDGEAVNGFKTGLNIRFLERILNANESDICRLRFKSPSHAVVFEDGDREFLIMPIMVNS